MTRSNVAELSGTYERVQRNGHLRTEAEAKRWTNGVLRQLGFELPRGTRKDLARALPDEWAAPLQRKFWLVHFRDKNKTAKLFLKQIALMGGNTDGVFAAQPTTAVFHELKAFAGSDLSDEVAEALAPELSTLWQQA